MQDGWTGGLQRWRTRAGHLAPENRRLFDENTTWLTRAAELESRVIDLEFATANEKIATLAKLCFGTKSERKRTPAAFGGRFKVVQATPARDQPRQQNQPDGAHARDGSR